VLRESLVLSVLDCIPGATEPAVHRHHRQLGFGRSSCCFGAAHTAVVAAAVAVLVGRAMKSRGPGVPAVPWRLLAFVDYLAAVAVVDTRTAAAAAAVAVGIPGLARSKPIGDLVVN